MLSAFWLVPTTDLIFIPSSRFKVFDSDGKRRLVFVLGWLTLQNIYMRTFNK